MVDPQVDSRASDVEGQTQDEFVGLKVEMPWLLQKEKIPSSPTFAHLEVLPEILIQEK